MKGSKVKFWGLNQQGGLGGNRTLASRFCRPQRFHFATRPTSCILSYPTPEDKKREYCQSAMFFVKLSHHEEDRDSAGGIGHCHIGSLGSLLSNWLSSAQERGTFDSNQPLGYCFYRWRRGRENPLRGDPC